MAMFDCRIQIADQNPNTSVLRRDSELAQTFEEVILIIEMSLQVCAQDQDHATGSSSELGCSSADWLDTFDTFHIMLHRHGLFIARCHGCQLPKEVLDRLGLFDCITNISMRCQLSEFLFCLFGQLQTRYEVLQYRLIDTLAVGQSL